MNRARETLATTASIYDDKHTMTLEAGSSSYEFTIDKSDEASHYLDSGNYVVLQDDKGKTWLFTILDYEETHNTKTVYAEDAGIELINKAVDIWKGDGPHPFSYYFDLVTKGTPWELGVNQLAGLSRTLTYEGRDTGLGRLLSILKGFDNAECTFDVTVKMNAPAEFKINVYKQVGNDRSDVQIVYNNELNDITKKESRAEFVTALAGVGGQIQTEDGSEGGNVDFSELEYNKDGFVTKKGDKFLRAVDANRAFNPGQESYIESFYEYDTQSPSELLNRTLSKLKTYSEPQYTYTADVKVIDSSLVLGDTVTILDHDYNPALYLSARVAKLVKSYTDPAQNEIEFTNYRLLSSALADKLARLQVIVNTLPSASRVSAIETNLTKLTKQQEEVIVKVESANGKNTNYYGASQPESAKQGDSWFYTDEEGNQGIKQYQDGVWVDVISSKFGPKLEADIKQTQDDMQGLSDEVEEARSKAQEAFAKTVDNATTVQNVIGDVAQAHADLEKAKQSLQTTSQGLDQARQDLISNSTRLDKLEVGVDGVTVNINSLNTKVDNIKIGGTNLIRNSGNPKTTDSWAVWGANPDHKLIVWSHPFWKNSQEKLFALFNRDSDGVQMKSNRFQVERNTEYTLSYWAFEDSNVISSNTFFLGRRNGETSDFTVVKTLVYSRQYSGAKAEYVTITFNTGEVDEGYIRFDNNGSKNVGQDAVLFLANIKLEKGNRATDYSPAPEDLIEKVVQFKVDLDGIRGTVANAQGDIAQIKLTENGMQQNIKDAQGNISTLQNDAKQFKQQFADVDGNIANLSASAKNFELQMQDAQGNISSLQNDAKQFKQQFADVNGNIVTIKRNATELSEQLASKVGNTEYQNFKTQTAKELSEKLVRTDLNGYATTAEVKMTADGLKEQYTQLNGKIDGIVVGGKNLLDNSDGQLIMGYGIDNTTWTNGKATLVYNHDYSKTNKSSEILPQTGSRNQWYRVNKDEELTQSIIVETDATYNPNGIYQFTWLTYEFGHRLITANIDVLGTNKYRLWCSFKWDKDQSCNVRIMDIQNLTRVLQINTSGTYISFYHPQIERGNKPSDWGMSDNDINKKISDANVSIAKTNETIKTVDGNVTTVRNSLDKTKSIVTQLSNLFGVNVGDSSISVTNNGVLVKGKQIHIDGQTLIDNGVIQGAKIADASIGTAKIADAAITSAKIANLDVNKLSGNKSTFVQSVWNGISGNNAKLTNSGIESVSGANRTVISGGKIETNSIVTKNTIHVGQEDSDPRKQWGVDIDNKGFWFGTPVKQPGHTTNNPSDYRYELQGAIRGYGWDYTKDDATGNGMSGLVIGLAEQSMWGGNYGGDFFAIGRYIKNSTQALESASFDPAISYNATNAGFGTYNDTVNIWKNTYVRGYFSAEYEDKTRFYVGANDGDVLFILQNRNNKNVIIDSSTHTGNGLIVKGSQNITNWLGCQDLSVRGNKNSVVQTSQGWTKINAYETAEYYFGDLGTTNTGANSLVRIDIDPIFKETVNTNVKYQVFLTSYGPGYAWVSERTENYFVIESNTPNLEVGYEIKAKRKGYEGVRLEIDRNMEERTNE